MLTTNCKIHGITRAHKNGKKNYPRCAQCSIERSRDTFRRTKQKAVDYMGGSCQVCGYDKYVGALEFHHVNPDEKSFNIAGSKYHKWDELVEELKKCILLCANCHREIEGGVTAF